MTTGGVRTPRLPTNNELYNAGHDSFYEIQAIIFTPTVSQFTIGRQKEI